MDPITALTAVAAGTDIASNAKGLASRGLQRIRFLGKVNPAWYSLDQGIDLSADEFHAVETFLGSDSAAPILRFLTVARLSPKTSDFSHILPALEKAFNDVISQWNAHNPALKISVKAAPALWQRLNDIYTLEFASVAANSEMALEIATYEDFLARPISKKTDTALSADFAGRLLDLASNLALLLKASERALQLTNAIKSAGKLPIIEHINSARSLSFDSLYVQRTFAVSGTSQRFPSENISAGITPFRSVIVGPPGAGKSTFVKHLQSRLLAGSDVVKPIPCVIVSCLAYSRDGWKESLQEAMVKQIRAAFSFPELTLPELEAMLLTGSFVAIFDGLDEITDNSQRSAMAQRINAFTIRYPAASVLVTSRIVGYENAPLDAATFQLIELLQFDRNQMAEYVDRWFKLADASHLASSFLAESESVSDLRTNPLLLSLLCNLYNSIGEIPANRREIYHECAQLLFRAWDSHRQIVHPHAMPKFRDQLMREIARWFHASSSAQSGVEEKVMRKELSNYMHDRVGLTRDEAYEQAGDFLEFCAGRAWLLTGIGTKNGQRVFGFTHRTFLEFFAAEAIVRRVSQPSEVAAAILNEDRTKGTVIPELLLQSYDAIRDAGATEVLVELCSRRQSPPPASTRLLMRLLDGAIIASYGLDKCFEEVVFRWTKKDQVTVLEDFKALLNINTIAREHFLGMLRSPERRDIRKHFFQFWASAIMTELFDAASLRWLVPVATIARDFKSELSAIDDPAINQWATTHNIYVSPTEPLSNALAYTGGRLGAGDGFLARFVKLGMPATGFEHLAAPLTQLRDDLLSDEKFNRFALETWMEWEPIDPSEPPPFSPLTEVQELAANAISVAFLAAYEAEVLDMNRLEEISGWCSHDIAGMAATRKAIVSDLSSPESTENDRTSKFATIEDLLEEWSKGLIYLAGNY